VQRAESEMQMQMKRRPTTPNDRPPLRRAGSRKNDIAHWSLGEGLLTAAEVARLLHISRSTVYKLMERGDLPSLRVRKLRRFRARDLERYLRRHSFPPRRPA
jgi:excisionase family DNA binding protein